MKEDNTVTTYYPCLQDENGVIVDSPNKTIKDKQEAIEWLEQKSDRPDVKFVLKETNNIYFNKN